MIVEFPCGHTSNTAGTTLAPDSHLVWCKTCGQVWHAETLKKHLVTLSKLKDLRQVRIPLS